MKKLMPYIVVKLIILSGLFFLFFLSSCNKYKTQEVHIDGTIYDPNTGVYVSGAVVTIAATSVSGSIYSSGYTDIITATTDASGKFTMDFEIQTTDDYKVRIAHGDYFLQTYTITADDMHASETHSLNYDIFPEAYIQLIVYNNSPYDSLDMISYSMGNTMPSCSECCTNTTLKGYDVDYRDTLFCKLYGNQDTDINWMVTKNGTTNAYNHMLYCTAFDTTQYTISY